MPQTSSKNFSKIDPVEGYLYQEKTKIPKTLFQQFLDNVADLWRY